MKIMSNIELHIKEYDLVDGFSECVHAETYHARWLGRTERTVRAFLAGGDYSEGDDNREVYVTFRGRTFRYTAPQIRRFRRVHGTREGAKPR